MSVLSRKMSNTRDTGATHTMTEEFASLIMLWDRFWVDFARFSCRYREVGHNLIKRNEPRAGERAGDEIRSSQHAVQLRFGLLGGEGEQSRVHHEILQLLTHHRTTIIH